MKCKAIVVESPSNFSYKEFNIGDIPRDEVPISPVFSSICQTDRHIIDGSLLYYSTGEAKYPIITGHEWVGYFHKTPVVGMCILSDEDRRVEVGVVNRHGAHSDILFMPQKYIFEVPSMEYKYALVEPLAVSVRGFNRLGLSGAENIIINGFGSIGRMFGRVLDYYGLKYDIYDMSISDSEPNWSHYNVIVECSGAVGVLEKFTRCVGCKILLYGLRYDSIDMGRFVSNENNIITSLGAYADDFRRAIEIMDRSKIDRGECDFYVLEDFSKALKCKRKVIFEHV